MSCLLSKIAMEVKVNIGSIYVYFQNYGKSWHKINIHILSMKVNIRWIYINSKIAMEVDISLIYVNFQNCNQSGYKLNIVWKYTNG